MIGWIRIDRAIFDHNLFKKEPMSEREAWMWMLSKAAYEDTKHRVGGDLLDVPRGSFMATLREMQSVFMWRSDSRVRSFLNRLENERMIERTKRGPINAPKTHVTICNYSEYQHSERTENAPKTHRPATQSRTKVTSKQTTTLKDTNVSLSVSPDCVPHANDVSEALAIYNEAADHAGWPKVQKMSAARTRSLKARLKDCDGLEGWRDALRRAYASDFIREKWASFGFDSLISQSKFTKLMEGSYDNRTNKPATATNGSANRSDPALEQIARLAGIGSAPGDVGGGVGSDGQEDGPLWMGTGPRFNGS